MEYTEYEKSEGTTVYQGGERHEGEDFFMKSTIFTDTNPSTRIVRLLAPFALPSSPSLLSNLAISLHLHTHSIAPLPFPLDVTDPRSQMDHCADDTPILHPISPKQVGPLLDDRRVLKRLRLGYWLGKDVMSSHQ